MRGDADRHRPSAAALLPIAAIAGIVLAVALLVSSSQTGTIVLQRISLAAHATQSGQANPPVAFSMTEISQTAANGTLQREFISNSFYRLGDEQTFTPQGGLELYDAHNNTIFSTTQSDLQRALEAQAGASPPKGAHVNTSVGRVQRLSAQYMFVPGKRSIFEQGLLAHEYRIAGPALIDGRPALKLVQSRSSRAALEGAAHGLSTDLTIYVTPVTFAPIEEIVRTRLPGVQSTAIERWLAYRVMPATNRNTRLLSLIARHPHARIVRDASAYLRAGQSQVQTVTTRS